MESFAARILGMPHAPLPTGRGRSGDPPPEAFVLQDLDQLFRHPLVDDTSWRVAPQRHQTSDLAELSFLMAEPERRYCLMLFLKNSIPRGQPETDAL